MPAVADVLLTPAALKRLTELAEAGTRVRLSIEAGGCAGFQRKFFPST
ncbi:MAG: iron-sulfur cluster assembly accessory protein, partial [Alphaproteobacteria bacterium]|nr:iron-sulfur cluster assembly accessory protein [Alphaproteobacteria bacterium]